MHKKRRKCRNNPLRAKDKKLSELLRRSEALTGSMHKNLIAFGEILNKMGEALGKPPIRIPDMSDQDWMNAPTGKYDA
jgi:hypothetical protein